MNWFEQWRFGANYTPASAINQLEMWQSETFDLPRIELELKRAHEVGMSIMRVFLHDLVYLHDKAGLLDRMEQFLTVADKWNIGIMFVFFDDCWRSEFAYGKQPEPIPFTHNSGWIQSPGSRAADDLAQRPRLKEYVQTVIRHFSGDPRIAAWDLYNEPGNGSSGDHKTQSGLRGSLSLGLLRDVFDWAREVAPSQPLTVAPWRFADDFKEINDFAFSASDVVSFHVYENAARTGEVTEMVQRIAAGRPVMCSEYMARSRGSFQDCLPVFYRHGVTAINWGLFSGKTQTIYPWGWNAEKGTPPVWFHDVFHRDGSFLYPEEETLFAEYSRKK